MRRTLLNREANQFMSFSQNMSDNSKEITRNGNGALMSMTDYPQSMGNPQSFAGNQSLLNNQGNLGLSRGE
jgi:hypothetical protein